jgi:hypothetical protein
LTTFKLSSLFLVMTLAAIAAGVFAANLVLGVFFLIVAVPAKAVTHAQRALALSDGAQPQWLEILAAAHAECGDFKAAIAWQTKAIEAAGEQAADEMSTRLANYVRLEPYRV